MSAWLLDVTVAGPRAGLLRSGDGAQPCDSDAAQQQACLHLVNDSKKTNRSKRKKKQKKKKKKKQGVERNTVK